MKKRIPTRVLSAFLAVIMVFLMIPFSAITVFAEESVSVNTDYSFNTSIKYQTEYRINNRYTTIYNTFNKPEQKTKWQNFTEGIGKAKGIVGKTGNLAVNLYTQIMGWDSSKEWYENTGKIALNLACSYFGIQLPGPSESDKTIEAVGQMIDGVHDHLNDMENNIVIKLSDVVRDSDAELAAFINDTQTEAEWRTYLNAFYGVGSNFNYDAFRINLYSAISELNTAYDLYDEALKSGDYDLIAKREKNIRTKYDKLYYVLTYSMSGGNYSPIVELRSRMTDGFATTVNNEDTICSIPKILYAYKIVCASNNGNSIENIAVTESCIGFALDLYNTYLLAEQCLNACYTYQLNDMVQNNNVSYTATYDDLSRDITDSDIKAGITTGINKQKEVTNKLVADIAFLLNLESSYTYQIGDSGEIFNIPYIEQVSEGDFQARNYPEYYGSFSKTDDWCRINNDVSSGDVIYMNLMPEMFAEMFKEGEFTFNVQQFASTNEEITATSTVTNTGVVNIVGNVGERIKVTMYYDGVECYHLEFDVVERCFNGGMGIDACPYLIEGYNQLIDIVKIENYLSASYKFVDNIDCTNKEAWVSIGSISNPFKGKIDGNGYDIVNMTGSALVSQNNGCIINLDIVNANITKGIVQSNKCWSSAICGRNFGIIDNCHIYESELNVTFNYSSDTLYHYMGGICAYNSGYISNASVNSSEIYCKNYSDGNYYDAVASVGALIGCDAYGEGKNLLSQNNTVNAHIKNASYDVYGSSNNDSSTAHFYLGGCIGACSNSTYENCIVTNTYPKEVWECSVKGDKAPWYNSGWDPESFCYKESHVNSFLGWDSDANSLNPYYVDPNTEEIEKLVTDPTIWEYENETKTIYLKPLLSNITITENVGDEKEITHVPTKTYYCVGDLLNLGGLIVYDNNGDTINGYSISGYNSDQAGLQEIQITYVTGYGTKKDTFTITVDEVQAEELLLFSKPANTTYELNTSMLDADGLMLLVRYNNGTSKILSNGENGDSKEYAQTFDFSTVGKSTVTFSYEGLTATLDVDVVCYHDNAILVEATNATCNDVGYTAGTYCNDCETYISGHEEIPVLSSHPYGEWTNFSDTQHSRVCACGEVEYATHNWNSGAITKPATHLAAGELTKTCSDCSATKIETIDPITNHSFGSWKVHDENQHIRTCECGEKEYADHAWNDGVVTTEPTHLASGEKTYTCTKCTATKTENIPPIEGHTFGKWTKRNDVQHVRSCECGETEYADHNWDDGTITTPATYEKEGERTYTCLECEATYTVTIPKPVSVHLFIVDDAGAVPGGTMQVNVRLENNPGIAMMRLKISYDSSMLTLDQITYNTEIGGTATQPTIYDGYVTLLWYNDSENVEGDWIFATLTFTVKDTAPVGSVSDIVLTYDAEEVCDIEENNVVFSIDNGSATVLDHVPGDINGDDGLTSKDLLRLARYFAGWDVEVNENALDINGDGNVNSKDLLRLARYLAGWDVEIH